MAMKDSGTSGGGRKPTGSTGRNRNAYCSFCRKSYRDVGPLVEGAGDVYICGGCVELCQSIIDQEKRRRGLSQESASPESTAGHLAARLAHFLQGQDEMAKALAAAGHCHYEHLARDQGGVFEGLDRVMAHRGRHPEQPVSTEDLRACGMLLDLAEH